MTHVDDLSVLSHHNEALSTDLAASHAANCELQVQLEVAEALHQLENTEHQVSDAHATICNLENQELCCQLTEKTRTCKKCKINMEGCIITPLDSVALFVQQDADSKVPGETSD